MDQSAYQNASRCVLETSVGFLQIVAIHLGEFVDAAEAHEAFESACARFQKRMQIVLQQGSVTRRLALNSITG
jgi:hypothetical protein